MKVSKSGDRLDEARKAAVLASKGMTEEEIAKRLGRSQATVHRRLRFARDRGFLVDRFPLCTLGDQEKRNLECEMYDVDRILRLLKHVRWLEVFDSGGTGTTPIVYDERLLRFGALAADYVADKVFGKAKRVGVTWGNTLGALIAGLQLRYSGSPRGGPPLQFVPLSGEPLYQPHSVRHTSSSLVEDLHRIVNGGAGTLPLTLGPVAAYIPGPFATRGARFDMDEQETIRRFVGSSEGYRRIFLGEQGSQRAAPVVHQLDTILTAVGPSSETPIGYGLDDAATAAGLDKTRLSDLTVGNIGGVFLPREELRDTDRATVLDLNRRWSGVKKQHLRRCDENARRTGAPGVIVFAIGKAKAEIVYECVRLRLVTQLVIDIDLAGELVRHQGCVP